MHASAPIAAPENKDYLSSVTLFGAVGKPLRGGKFYMQLPSTDIPSVKRFLVALAGALYNPYGPRPYLVMDNAPAHHSHQVREEMSRFRACF